MAESAVNAAAAAPRFDTYNLMHPPDFNEPESCAELGNTTFMTYDLMHLAALIRTAGGIPAYGNRRSEWDAGCIPDRANPEHR